MSAIQSRWKTDFGFKENSPKNLFGKSFNTCKNFPENYE